MNITEQKFHALLMYTGRLPVHRGNESEAMRIIRRAMSLISVAGLQHMPNKGQKLDDWMNLLLDGVDLLYGYPTDSLRYLIAMEYVDTLRKRQYEEKEHG